MGEHTNRPPIGQSHGQKTIKGPAVPVKQSSSSFSASKQQLIPKTGKKSKF